MAIQREEAAVLAALEEALRTGVIPPMPILEAGKLVRKRGQLLRRERASKDHC